jgi:hypothetical protein
MMMKLRLAQSLLVASFFGISSASASVVVQSFGVVFSDPQENLFTAVGEPTGPSLLAGTNVVQEWPVTINLARLQSLPGTVILNLPNELPETLNKIRSSTRGPNGFVWTGGGEGCSALLSAIPGAFRATISCLSGTYSVETTSSGSRLARYSYGPAPAGAEYDVAAPSNAGASNSMTPPPSSPNTPLLVDQVVDVMILYTANVRQALQASNINVQ